MSLDKQKQFFQDSYEYLKNRYGEDNVISATVHLDETTPHMHFNFVPVTKDGRLSAKSILTRQNLIEQQTSFFESVGKKYNLERGLPGGKKKHLEVLDYKLKTVQEEFEAIVSERNALKTELDALKINFKQVNDLLVDFDKIDAIKGDFGLIGKKKVKIKTEDFNDLKEIAKYTKILESKTKDLKYFKKENDELKTCLDDLRTKNFEDYKESKEMSNELSTVNDYLIKNNQLEDYNDFKNYQKQIQQSKIYEMEL